MRLNYKRTIFVGFAFFLISAFWQAYDTIIPKILTNRFGMAQSYSGVVMALDNVLALFLLPFFGALSDKCASRRGRRTPFIIVGTILAAAAFLVLSFADNMQLSHLSDAVADAPASYKALYDADLTINTPGGEKIAIREKFTEAEFTALAAEGDSSESYTEYVLPAKSAYAWKQTASSPGTLIFFR